MEYSAYMHANQVCQTTIRIERLAFGNARAWYLWRVERMALLFNPDFPMMMRCHNAGSVSGGVSSSHRQHVIAALRLG